MAQQHLLAAHPSVQDLGIQYGGINLAKTSLHRQLINSKPLHEMTTSDFAAATHRKGGNRATEPKDAKVTVIKNASVGFGPSAGGGSSGGPPPTFPLGSQGGTALPAIPTPIPSPASRAGGRPNAFSVTNTRTNAQRVVTQLPPRKNPSLASSAFSYSADGCSDCGSFSMYSCSCCHVKPPSTVGSAATNIPPSSVGSSQRPYVRGGRQYKAGTTYCERSGSAKRLQREQREREAAGRLSAVELGRLRRSLGDTDGSGSSLAGPTKGGGGGTDDYYAQYENLTSVSQRLGSSASVTSTQIASLQQELESERRTRLQTQLELQSIRERQKELLDRLASKEHGNMTADDKYTIRRMLKEVNQQMTAMGAAAGTSAAGEPVRGSTVGAPIAPSDSVMQ